MSDRDNAMADAIASRVVSGAIDAAQDPERMRPIVDNVSAQIQLMVGRAVLRALFYVLVGLLMVGSFKFDWLRRGMDLFGGKG
jgi:hypothetical protein